MHNTRVGSSFCDVRSETPESRRVALSAGGLSVDGGVFLNKGFIAEGELRMVGAHLRTNLTISGATLRNAGGVALNLNRASMSVMDGSELSCTGSISMVSAQVASDLILRNADVKTST
jgi:hypothetical protein